MSASLSLDLVPSNIERARLFTEETLHLWCLDWLTDPACVVVAELVRNAFEHAKTAVTVDLQNSDGGVRISVRDGASLSRRRMKHRQGIEPARGLDRVIDLASDWGVEPTGSGKVVWALIIENLTCEGATTLDFLLRRRPDDITLSYCGFRVSMIDEPSAVPRNVGTAIVRAPDGTVAWLLWQANVRRYVLELCAPDDRRWGAWRVGLPQPLTTGEEGRVYFAALIPDLRARWEAWRESRA